LTLTIRRLPILLASSFGWSKASLHPKKPRVDPTPHPLQAQKSAAQRWNEQGCRRDPPSQPGSRQGIVPILAQVIRPSRGVRWLPSTMMADQSPWRRIEGGGFEGLSSGLGMDERMMEWLDLKNVTRAGWVRAGVDKPESVAAHSWGMSILALRLCPPELDLARVLSLCLVHDLPEVRVGDLTPHDDCSTKAEDERAAMLALAPEWIELFDDYEHGNSPEARFVKQLDKLDMGLQAKVYQRTQHLNLDEFIESAKKRISDPNLRVQLE